MTLANGDVMIMRAARRSSSAWTRAAPSRCWGTNRRVRLSRDIVETRYHIGQ
jgi:hypothetical protein